MKSKCNHKFCHENTVCILTLKGLNNKIFKILIDVIVYTLILESQDSMIQELQQNCDQ